MRDGRSESRLPMKADALHRPKVLLVDDDAEMRAYLRLHLDPHYDIIEAARGDDGLQAVRSELPDVIVSDILMPGLDGYALCRAVKSDPETDCIPLILLTSKTDAQSKLEGLEGGADDYISKPFDPAELRLRIRNLLLARARLKARFAADSAPARPGSSPFRVPSSDAAFRQRVKTVLEAESHAPSFDAAALARRLNMSRTHLHRRATQALGLPPAELIIRFRLERAARMLNQRSGTVGEIAHAVGFKDLSHFVRRFRESYGQTPAAYAAAQNS